MRSAPSSAYPARRAQLAFTLLEVMIAVGIFFVCLIAILGVLSRGISAARSLQISGPDAGIVAAQLSITNQLFDGKTLSGDFGRAYPGFTWEAEQTQIASNCLFEVDVFVFKKGGRGPELYDAMCMWLYKPESPAGQQVSRPIFGGATSAFGDR